MDIGLQILRYIFFLHHLESLLQVSLEVVRDVSINGRNVVNTARPLLSKVPDKKSSLLLRIFLYQR